MNIEIQRDPLPPPMLTQWSVNCIERGGCGIPDSSDSVIAGDTISFRSPAPGRSAAAAAGVPQRCFDFRQQSGNLFLVR